MARISPKNITLSDDWRERTLKHLTEPPFSSRKIRRGSEEYKEVERILRHKSAKVAVQYLFHACDGEWPLYLDVLNKAFRVCVGTKALADVAPTIDEELARGLDGDLPKHARKIRRVAEQIWKRSESYGFVLYGLASRLDENYPNPIVEDRAIVRSLYIVEDVMRVLAWRLKGPKGRPVKIHQKGLVVYLATLFREHLGNPVAEAVAALVTATFERKTPLTGKAVLEILARKKPARPRARA